MLNVKKQNLISFSTAIAISFLLISCKGTASKSRVNPGSSSSSSASSVVKMRPPVVIAQYTAPEPESTEPAPVVDYQGVTD